MVKHSGIENQYWAFCKERNGSISFVVLGTIFYVQINSFDSVLLLGKCTLGFRLGTCITKEYYK